METPNQKYFIGKNSFVKALKINWETATIKHMLSQEKTSFKMVGNFMAFCSPVFHPLSGTVKYSQKGTSHFLASPLRPNEKSRTSPGFNGCCSRNLLLTWSIDWNGGIVLKSIWRHQNQWQVPCIIAGESEVPQLHGGKLFWVDKYNRSLRLWEKKGMSLLRKLNNLKVVMYRVGQK